MKNLLDVNDPEGGYPATYYASAIEPLPQCAQAVGDLRCDVCVVGGGFTGLSTALHLAERGYDVRLLEAQRIGFGASGRNGGQVGQGQRLDQDELESMVGVEHARELWTIGTEAVERVRALAESPLVHASFHPGVLNADHKPRFSAHSKAYAERLQQEYGHTHIRYIEQQEMREWVASSAYYSGTLDTSAGHIDPLQLALGVARMAQSAGAQLHEKSRVISVSEEGKPVVRTDKARITADHVVLACNGYVGDLHKDVASRIMPINNYIVATEPLAPEVQESLIRGNIAVADSKYVVNYFRFSDDHRLLFGGSESYTYRFPDDIATQVRKPLTAIFAQLANTKIDYAWGGTLGITRNRMPHFERYGQSTLSLSGFSGHGVAMGTMAGQIAAETIAGQAERFDTMARVPTHRFPGGKTMRHPMLVLGMLWYSLMDRL